MENIENISLLSDALINNEISSDDSSSNIKNTDNNSNLKISNFDDLNTKIKILSLFENEIEIKKGRSEELNNRIQDKVYFLERIQSNIEKFSLELISLSEKEVDLKNIDLKEINTFSSILSKIEFNIGENLENNLNLLNEKFKNISKKVVDDIKLKHDSLKQVEREFSYKIKEMELLEEKIKNEKPDIDVTIKNLKLKNEISEREIEKLRNTIESLNKSIVNNLDMDNKFENEKENLLQNIDSKNSYIKEIDEEIINLKSEFDKSINIEREESEIKIRELSKKNDLIEEELLKYQLDRKEFESIIESEVRQKYENEKHEMELIIIEKEKIISSLVEQNAKDDTLIHDLEMQNKSLLLKIQEIS